MEDVQEIRLPKRLPDFGLSARARRLRNRLSAMGYRLWRDRCRKRWEIYRVLLGADDQFQMTTTKLDLIEDWTKKREEEILARADLALAQQARKF